MYQSDECVPCAFLSRKISIGARGEVMYDLMYRGSMCTVIGAERGANDERTECPDCVADAAEITTADDW